MNNIGHPGTLELVISITNTRAKHERYKAAALNFMPFKAYGSSRLLFRSFAGNAQGFIYKPAFYSKLAAFESNRNRIGYFILEKLMLPYDEKRDYHRMDVDCDITYRPADGHQVKTGRCTNLSGAGISFIADQGFDLGLAMEVSVLPKSSLTPPMTAFVEVVRSIKNGDGNYEIAASIKSIKGN
ncbi:MAG: PilZ domain-containing protein [Methylomonas sp.]